MIDKTTLRMLTIFAIWVVLGCLVLPIISEYREYIRISTETQNVGQDFYESQGWRQKTDRQW